MTNKIVVFIILLLTSASSVHAQSAAVSASVTIISSVIFLKTEDIWYDKMFLNSNSFEELILTNGGQSNRSLYIPKIFSFENTKKAVFSIYANDANFYSISSKEVITLIHNNGQEHMYGKATIEETSLLNSLGNRDILVNTKVYFDHSQLPGLYTSKNFTVTVNFN